MLSQEACPLQRVSSEPPTPRGTPRPMGEGYCRKDRRAWVRRRLQGSSSPGRLRRSGLERVGAAGGLLGSAAPQLRLLEPDGTHDAPRWNGSGMSDTLLSGYTVFPSFPLAKMRNRKVTPGAARPRGNLGRAIRWLEPDHNRRLTVPTGCQSPSPLLWDIKGPSDPVLGICPRQPYLRLALSVLGFPPA